MNDLEKAAVEGVATVVKDLAKSFAQTILTLGKNQLAKLSVDLEIAFRGYLERSVRKHSKIKTLLNPNIPVNLDTAYVPLLFSRTKTETDTINEDHILTKARNRGCIVITGVGGSGKSVFLKHLFIKMVRETVGKIPIYIELRSIPDGISVKEYLLRQISAISPQFGADLFEYALADGKFVFLMDAVDEVDPDRRNNVAQQILDMTYAHGDNSFIITSRPDVIFDSWNEFEVFKVKEFTKAQVKNLIKKAKWNAEQKKSFNKAVDSGLYDSHKTFLANPLLCTIMLLTFGDGSDIPSKMHIFFSRAFDVLFYRHDAMKQTGYRRKLKSGLGDTDFKRLASGFGTVTYLYHGSAFSHEAAHQSAAQAVQIEGLQTPPEDFVSDFCKATCIIIDETERFSFIHRTFQEYFVAQFLSERNFPEWLDLLDKIMVERGNDSIADLIMDMNRNKLDTLYILPKLNQIIDIMERVDIDNNPLGVFNLFFSGFTLSSSSKEVEAYYLHDRQEKKQGYWHILRLVRARFGLSFYETAKAPFNWRAHVASLPGKFETKIEQASNAAIIGSPIQTALHELKLQLIQIRDGLKRTAQTQDDLLANLLPASPKRIAKSQ